MIDAQHVAYRYPGQTAPALDGVNLKVRTGSLFGLLGPNGSGKTTLISILSGILRAQSGELRVAGFEIPASLSHVQQLSSLVPQENAFYPTLTVAENLQFFVDILPMQKGERAGRVAEALRVTGLENAVDVRGERLSGGMKRRLSIAIGLLNSPRLLFLDEPTVGIDPQSRQFLLDAIKEINLGGTTVVYCSHYMEEVEYLCDEVAILDHGRVLIQGHIDSLLEESRAAASARPQRAAGLQELFFSLTHRDLRDGL